jgi:NAD(P)-dependent dehydrogenase (short-subunit alcohol dehydrogenase family)
MEPLPGKVAVVAGATRGAGRAIAISLAESGATVYCTGRSVRGNTTGRPETIDETAELCGGRGIAVRCDHANEKQVAALFARVREEAGRLDILVNDTWGGDSLVEWGRPFWELSLANTRTMLRSAVWAHIVTARLGVPLMIPQKAGLVVEITDGDFLGCRGNLAYDLAKIGPIRLAQDMAHELRPLGIAAVAVTPGFLRSEAMLERFGVTEASWRDAIAQDRHFAHSETPWFVARAIAHLAADPQVLRKSGGVHASWTLAREYGFTDRDGTTPDWGAHWEGEIARILEASDPRPDDRFLLQIRALQIELDPARAGELQRIHALLDA